MGREPAGAMFEPIRVGGGGRRTVGLGVAWLVALVAVAGIAAANVMPGDRDDVDGVARATDAPSSSRTVAPDPDIVAGRPIAILDIVEARSFDAAAGGINRRLDVTGQLLVRAARVRITLEGREDHILGTVAPDVVPQLPGTSAELPGTFLAAFELPASRSGGVWITVTAFDAAGDRIGRVRERVEVYPIEPRAYAERAFGTFEPGA